MTIRSVNVTGLTIIGLTFMHTIKSSFLIYLNSEDIIILNSTFLSSGASAIHCEHSTITVINSFFQDNRGISGAAIRISRCNLTVIGSTFTENKAVHGGAIDAYEGLIVIKGMMKNKFYLNSDRAIGCDRCTIKVEGLSIFENNTYIFQDILLQGGAIRLIYGASLTISGTAYFLHNRAVDGGAISVFKSKISFDGSNVTFEGNSAENGGAIHLASSEMFGDYERGRFIHNTAKLSGGAISVGKCFINYDREDLINFHGETWLESNSASIGGAIRAECAKIRFIGNSVFKGNSADSNGGALYALSSDILFYNHASTEFRNNSALYGGAMYIDSSSFIITPSLAIIKTYYNSAKRYGGAIYHKDAPTFSQCINHKDELPYCFLQWTQYHGNYRVRKYQIISMFDTAGISGNFLYGGLLDRCKLNNILISAPFEEPYSFFFSFIQILSKLDEQITRQTVTSKPYRLCFCNSSNTCNTTRSIAVHRGRVFSVHLQAGGQGGATSTEVMATTNQYFSRLKLSESTQILYPNCTQLSYTIYSTQDNEDIVLHVDGACKENNLDSAVLHVTLLPCPDAFTLSGDECTCEERLQQYNAACTIGDRFIITRNTRSAFWMSALYDNGSYQGLILYKTCPTDYCKRDSTPLTLDDLDLQCAPNRSGVLCGACASNYSLLLGSSQCGICPNTYLALLLPFAGAGISLVAFLSLLKLTVATGVLNSLIVYVNIVQANRNLFFPDNTVNVLTVFIAWLNLDLGFEACFYNGMDAYVQTWLQFAFPVFVWILISLIIVTSRYSVTVSKLIGHNPIAVLATLLLMSYTKILKIIIDVFSYVKLDYPDNEQVTVWLKDANEPYLQSRHLALAVMTCLVFVFLFLPYTLFLLLGHKLYCLSGKKHFHWLNRLKPLLESYHGPYRIHTRYWTGFLLVVRCVLYLIFSYNSLGATSKSLLAINITFTIIVSKITLFSGRIYRQLIVNIIEVGMYVNLITLSAFTQAQMNSAVVVYSSVGVAFVVMLGVIVHHFHLLYTAKTALWLKMKVRISGYLQRNNIPKEIDEPLVALPKDSHITSKTVIDLREPLLEN